MFKLLRFLYTRTKYVHFLFRIIINYIFFYRGKSIDTRVLKKLC